MGLGLQPVRTTNSETQVPISAITVISCPGWAVYLLLVNGGMLSWFLVKSLLWWICVKAFSFYIFCTIDMQESQSLFPCSSLTRLGSKQFMSHVIPFWMLNCFVTVIWGGMNNKHQVDCRNNQEQLPKSKWAIWQQQEKFVGIAQYWKANADFVRMTAKKSIIHQ
jgi:hypothetical protein